MSRTPRPLAAFALVAVVVLLSACGSTTSPSSGKTSADGGSTGKRDAAEKFSQCMRKNGVSGFPDPDASGSITIDQVANGTSVDTDSSAFTQALHACKSLEPVGFTGTARTPEQQAAALKFAQCVRNHGVSDFPDPAADAPMIDTNLIPSTRQPGGMDALHAAMQQCSTDAAAAGIAK